VVAISIDRNGLVVATFFITLAVLFLIAYIVVEFGASIYAERHPIKPYPDDSITDSLATVSEDFSSVDGRIPRTGKVELNGSIWSAETMNETDPLNVGAICRVVGRNGLTVEIESERVT